MTMTNSASSRLLGFYQGGVSDSEGRYLDEILAFSDEQLEECHDYIQWLFPLDEPSRFNKNAPLLTESELSVFREDKAVQENFTKALKRIFEFYGFDLNIENDGNDDFVTFKLMDDYKDKWDNWLRPMNHNLLRITRIFKSMILFGHKELASLVLLLLLDHIGEENMKRIKSSVNFWFDALGIDANCEDENEQA
jgi:hypothetical protein